MQRKSTFSNENECNLRVPEDISLTCCEDIQEDYCELSITSAGVNQFEMGQKAAHLLLEKMRGKGDNPFVQRVQIIPTLTKRESVRDLNAK